MLKRFLCCPAFSEIDVIRRHQRAGAVLVIFKEGIDELSLVLWSLLENLVDEICRKFLQHVDHIVEVELVYDVLKLRICDYVYNLELYIAVKISKNINRYILRQCPKEHYSLGDIELIDDLFQNFCYIYFIIFKELISALEVFLLFKQFKNLLFGLFDFFSDIVVLVVHLLVNHGRSSPFPSMRIISSSSIIETPSSLAFLFLAEPDSVSLVMR